jgi:hypothetical protein
LKKDISIIMRMMRRTIQFTFENSKYAFRSPTGLIKDFHEEFDTIPEAKKYVIRHKLSITWEQLAWDMLGDMASLRGQPCTATVSPCLINGNAGA